jgi:molecular chaperone Hsp33
MSAINSDTIQRFLLEDLDIRGAHVRLGASWQAILKNRNFPPAVTRLLGEMTAITSLIGGNLKQAGRLTFQLRGDGQIPMMVVDCTAALNVRGYASVDTAPADDAALHTLLGSGRLLMTLDIDDAPQPFQSYVPIEGDTLAQVFEHYLELSEQQPAWLMLYADAEGAAGLFLQKLPNADVKDIDGWSRVTQLAQTLKNEELIGLDSADLLTRLFHEETVRIYEARSVEHNFPPDRDKIATMLRSLGREEIERIISEQGEVIVNDDLSNHRYDFSPEEARALFEQAPTLH